MNARSDDGETPRRSTAARPKRQPRPKKRVSKKPKKAVTAKRARPKKKAPPKKRVGKPKKKILKRAKPKGRGPPPYKPTADIRQMVEGMVACGLKRTQIANILDISPTTLRAHFEAELKNGDAKAIYNVATSLYKNATTKNSRHQFGDVTAQIFFLKTRAKWREVQRHEVGGIDGEPISHAIDNKNLDKLSPKELAALYAEAVGAPTGR